MANQTYEARKASTTSRKLTADEFAESLRPIVEQAREMGITSHDRLADFLTEKEIPTATGLGIWGHDATRSLKARLKKLDAQR